MAAPASKKPFIFVNLIVFVGLLAINGYSSVRSPLFPRSIGNVSNEFPTDITPSSSTFGIWGFIYAFQTAWIIYSLTLLCRKDAPDILPATFYVSFSASSVLTAVWIVAWVREDFKLCLALLFATVISLAGSVVSSSIGLHKFLNNEKNPVEIDVWCTRILIQNGIIFYNTWVLIATCINLVVTLQYRLDVSATSAASTALSILFGTIVFWFIAENFVFKEYTRFILAEYIVLIVALCGIIKAHWTGGGGNQTLVLVILIVSSLLFIARIFLIYLQERKKPTAKINEEASMA